MAVNPSNDVGVADEREIRTSRVFNAPRSLVWRAWTDPQMVAQWWGPKGFGNTFYTHDPRPGGRWVFTMHGPDGHDYENEIVFAEIVAPERLVLDHVCWPHFRATVVFHDLGDKTRIDFAQLFEKPEDYQKVKAIATKGNQEWGERLAERLDAFAAGNDAIVLTRTYPVPRDKVWRAFTESEQLAKWFGPNGFTLTTLAHECRPGGVWRWVFHGPDGTDYKDRIDYLEVVPGQRLVYSHSDDGAGAQPPFHVTVLFGEHDGSTTVTMRSQFVSAAERARIVGFGAIEGGKQTLARLATHLDQI